MLRELAKEKGDNIALVLDCCFSPVQTAEHIRERCRTRWTPVTKAHAKDLLRGLWPSAREHPELSHFGFLDPSPTTHVVMSACPPGSIAVEGKDGGRFTSALLNSLSHLTLHRTTYDDLIADVNRHMIIEGQQAVCVGKNRNSVFFNDVPFIVDPQFVSVSSERSRDLRIDAGEIHGVVEGSEFSLHEHNYRCSKNPSFATVVVYEIHPTWSMAQLKVDDCKIPRTCWAHIVRWNNHNPFAIKLKTSVVVDTFTSIANMAKGFKLKRDLPLDTTRTLRSTGIDVRRVKSMGNADISVTMFRTGVVLDRHDSMYVTTGQRSVRIPDTSAIKVLNDAALFDLHLQMKNPKKPLDGLAHVEVYRLDGETMDKVGSNLLSSSSNFFRGGAVVHCASQPIFTVRLENRSPSDLWSYLVGMDPRTHAAGMIYPLGSKRRHSPPLVARSAVEVVARWPWGWGPGKEAGGFVKVYLSTRQVRFGMYGQSQSRPCTTSVLVSELWDSFVFYLSLVCN